jgi:hypothetical protein
MISNRVEFFFFIIHISLDVKYVPLIRAIFNFTKLKVVLPWNEIERREFISCFYLPQSANHTP